MKKSPSTLKTLAIPFALIASMDCALIHDITHSRKATQQIIGDKNVSVCTHNLALNRLAARRKLQQAFPDQKGEIKVVDQDRCSIAYFEPATQTPPKTSSITTPMEPISNEPHAPKQPQNPQ